MAKAIDTEIKTGPSELVMIVSLVGILEVLRPPHLFSNFFIFIPSPLQEHHTICYTSNLLYTLSLHLEFNAETSVRNGFPFFTGKAFLSSKVSCPFSDW